MSQCYEELEVAQTDTIEEYALNDWERWDWDMDLEKHDGWYMTAFARKLLGGIGGYRTATANGQIYMVILDARRAQ